MSTNVDDVDIDTRPPSSTSHQISPSRHQHDRKDHHHDHSPGSGHLTLSTSSPRARFSTSKATYPLKLLSPTPLSSQPPNVGLAYTLAYGGGLVAGDVISLRVEIEKGGGLVMLTQGSTKVFKHRSGIRHSSLLSTSRVGHSGPAGNGTTDPHATSTDSGMTRQRLHVKLESDSFLLLLPDSVSPFRGSNYAQAQRFILPPDGTASVLILDWVNSGRGQQAPRSQTQVSSDIKGEGSPGHAEIWSMDQYISTNEVFRGDKLVMREKMVLSNTESGSKLNQRSHSTPSGLSPVADRLAPYHVYATVLILGPHFVRLVQHLQSISRATRQFKVNQPSSIMWSFSDLSNNKGPNPSSRVNGSDADATAGGVLRVAGEHIEDVRIWLRAALDAGGVKDLVGDGLWPRCI